MYMLKYAKSTFIKDIKLVVDMRSFLDKFLESKWWILFLIIIIIIIIYLFMYLFIFTICVIVRPFNIY